MNKKKKHGKFVKQLLACKKESDVIINESYEDVANAGPSLKISFNESD